MDKQIYEIMKKKKNWIPMHRQSKKLGPWLRFSEINCLLEFRRPLRARQETAKTREFSPMIGIRIRSQFRRAIKLSSEDDALQRHRTGDAEVEDGDQDQANSSWEHARDRHVRPKQGGFRIEQGNRSLSMLINNFP